MKVYAKKLVANIKDHFIPHEGNNHHPHVLQHHVLFGYSAILVLLKILAITAGFGITNLNLNATAITPSNIVALVNQARANAGLPILKTNVLLSQAANAKANDMLEKQYFAHTSPEGITPWHWINQTGYTYEHSGENLAVHYKEAENVQSGWMASPTHKKNILNPDFMETGVGIASGKFEDYDTIFVVQMFGKPTTPTITQKTQDKSIIEDNEIDDAPALVINTDPIELPNKSEQPTIQIPSLVKGEESIATQKPITIENVNIKPTASGYNVQAEDELASSIKIELGQANTLLNKNSENSWSGSIVRLPPENSSNIPMLISGQRTDENGLTTQEPLAWVMQGSSLNALFSSNERPKSNKLFGIVAREDIQNAIQIFYLFLLVFLIGSLTLYVFVKFHIQNVKVISHTLSVMGLIIILLLM